MTATALSITKDIPALRSIFNKLDQVYYFKDATEPAQALTADLKLPVLEDSITFNTGEAEVTRVNLIDGQTWTSMADKGDAEISFQIPSLAGDINDIFGDKVTSAAVGLGSSIGGVEFGGGAGYRDTAKKVTGALLFVSQDKQNVVLLPNIEAYASLVLSDGDNPAYYNVQVTPLADDNNASWYIIPRKEASGE